VTALQALLDNRDRALDLLVVGDGGSGSLPSVEWDDFNKWDNWENWRLRS
jgi:hypothetical protein